MPCPSCFQLFQESQSLHSVSSPSKVLTGHEECQGLACPRGEPCEPKELPVGPSRARKRDFLAAAGERAAKRSALE